MFDIKGKYNTAKIFTDIIDPEAIAQITELCNQKSLESSQIRIMPDVHAGAGCTVGTTMTITDKIIPNLVGVDIGCLDRDSEVLTPNGWIKICNYNNENILTYNPCTGVASYTQPLAYIKLPCNEFYHFHHTKGLDQMFSDEHRMLIYKGYKHKGYKTFTINATDFVSEASNKCKLDYYGCNTVFDIATVGLTLPDTLIRILVMISADGRVRYNKTKTKTYVDLHFKKQRKIDRAIMLLAAYNIKYNISTKLDSTYITFTLPMFFDKSLQMFYSANQQELKAFCDEIYFWDGCIDTKHSHKIFSTTNKVNADVVQFALATQGIRARISTTSYPNNPNWKDSYIVYQTKNNIVTYNTPDSISRVSSTDGYKYCFTTSTGYFVMRRHNNISITGNCGMEVANLGKVDIDFAQLDQIIREKIPSGCNIREKGHTFINQIKLSEFYCEKILDFDRAEKSIGSLGGGNHFIEIDVADDGTKYLVIHSGSRHLGVEVCKYYQQEAYKEITKRTGKEAQNAIIERCKKEGRLQDISEELKSLKPLYVNKDLAYCEGDLFKNYIHDMKIAQRFANLNRLAMKKEILDALGIKELESFTTLHNYIDTNTMILRKGSVSAQKGEKLIIPINMRDGSLICIGKGNPDWNYSAPHGAGRLMSRSAARQNLSLNEFQETMKDVYTTSVGYSTLDESPMAYKSLSDIVDNIQDTVDIVSIIKPVYNFKAGE